MNCNCGPSPSSNPHHPDDESTEDDGGASLVQRRRQYRDNLRDFLEYVHHSRLPDRYGGAAGVECHHDAPPPAGINRHWVPEKYSPEDPPSIGWGGEEICRGRELVALSTCYDADDDDDGDDDPLRRSLESSSFDASNDDVRKMVLEESIYEEEWLEGDDYQRGAAAGQQIISAGQQMITTEGAESKDEPPLPVGRSQSFSQYLKSLTDGDGAAKYQSLDESSSSAEFVSDDAPSRCDENPSPCEHPSDYESPSQFSIAVRSNEQKVGDVDFEARGRVHGNGLIGTPSSSGTSISIPAAMTSNNSIPNEVQLGDAAAARRIPCQGRRASTSNVSSHQLRCGGEFDDASMMADYISLKIATAELMSEAQERALEVATLRARLIELGEENEYLRGMLGELERMGRLEGLAIDVYLWRDEPEMEIDSDDDHCRMERSTGWASPEDGDRSPSSFGEVRDEKARSGQEVAEESKDEPLVDRGLEEKTLFRKDDHQHMEELMDQNDHDSGSGMPAFGETCNVKKSSAEGFHVPNLSPSSLHDRDNPRELHRACSDDNAQRANEIDDGEAVNKDSVEVLVRKMPASNNEARSALRRRRSLSACRSLIKRARSASAGGSLAAISDPGENAPRQRGRRQRWRISRQISRGSSVDGSVASGSEHRQQKRQPAPSQQRKHPAPPLSRPRITLAERIRSIPRRLAIAR